jgi:hypothetical protein
VAGDRRPTRDLDASVERADDEGLMIDDGAWLGGWVRRPRDR